MRTLLLFSGGIDSTLAALMLRSANAEVLGLSILFPRRPASEVAVSRQLAPLIGLSQLLEFSYTEPVTERRVGTLAQGSALCGWIPYRNLLFWSIAAHVAVSVGATTVAAGHDRDDLEAFSDVSDAFFTTLRIALQYSGRLSTAPISVSLPLMERTDDAIYRTARDHHELLAATWSCWRDVSTPCNVCYACNDRQHFVAHLNHLEAPS